MSKQISWKKLGKYVSGECSPEERQRIQNWVKADPKREQLIRQVETVWDESKGHYDWDTDVAWEKVAQELDEKGRQSRLSLVKTPADQIKNKSYSGHGKKSQRVRFLAYAAVASIAFTIAFLFYLTYPGTPKKPQDKLAMQELVVEKGQRAHFRLSDGTLVWLNADSKLKVPAQFTSATREVFLEGEAFFKVAPNPDKPFIVHAGKSVTKVLGTQFNVKAYPDDVEVQVVVKEGKVAFGVDSVSMDGNPKLTGNQMGVLLQNGQTSVSRVQSLEEYIGWRNGKLVFKDTPLHEAIIELERWYNINCTIADSALRTRTITAAFEDEPMAEVLKVISLSIGMIYDRSERNITFYPKKNKARIDQ